MIPSLRPVLPLSDSTAPRWGSSIRLRPRHVFHVQQFLSHGTKGKKERESSLRRWNFPRKPMPYWSKIGWITCCVPILPIRLILLIGLCLYRNWQSWNLPMLDKSVKISSRLGYFFYDIGSGCVDMLSIMMQPWGLAGICKGPSMQPTMPVPPTPFYASYAYIDKRDVRRGDVVIVVNPESSDGKRTMCKRIAALEGEWIRVTRYGPSMTIGNKIVHVRRSHIIRLLTSVFTYGHNRYHSDTAFWLGIILQNLMTQGHSVRCRLNPFWLKCNGDAA